MKPLHIGDKVVLNYDAPCGRGPFTIDRITRTAAATDLHTLDQIEFVETTITARSGDCERTPEPEERK